MPHDPVGWTVGQALHRWIARRRYVHSEHLPENAAIAVSLSSGTCSGRRIFFEQARNAPGRSNDEGRLGHRHWQPLLAATSSFSTGRAMVAGNSVEPTTGSPRECGLATEQIFRRRFT